MTDLETSRVVGGSGGNAWWQRPVGWARRNARERFARSGAGASLPASTHAMSFTVSYRRWRFWPWARLYACRCSFDEALPTARYLIEIGKLGVRLEVAL